jgi:hypothetical protein
VVPLSPSTRPPTLLSSITCTRERMRAHATHAQPPTYHRRHHPPEIPDCLCACTPWDGTVRQEEVVHLRSSARQHSSFVEHGEGLTQKARARYIAPVGRTPPVHRCCSVSQSAKGGRQFGPSRRKVVGERRRAPHRAGAFAPVWASGVCWALWRVVRWCVWPPRTGWTQRRRHGRGC